MFPWLWKEERVSYLKTSSHLIAPASSRAGLISLACTPRYCNPFLSGSCTYSLQYYHQCKHQLAAFLFRWVVSSVRTGATSSGPSTDFAIWLAHEARIKDPVQIAGACMCVLKCVHAHEVRGGSTPVWVCVSDVCGNARCLLHSGPLMGINKLPDPNPATLSCRCSLIFLAGIVQTALSAGRTPQALLCIV